MMGVDGGGDKPPPPPPNGGTKRTQSSSSCTPEGSPILRTISTELSQATQDLHVTEPSEPDLSQDETEPIKVKEEESKDYNSQQSFKSNTTSIIPQQVEVDSPDPQESFPHSETLCSESIEPDGKTLKHEANSEDSKLSYEKPCKDDTGDTSEDSEDNEDSDNSSVDSILPVTPQKEQQPPSTQPKDLVQTPAQEISKPKFVFGSAAKSLVTFNTIAKTTTTTTDAQTSNWIADDSPSPIEAKVTATTTTTATNELLKIGGGAVSGVKGSDNSEILPSLATGEEDESTKFSSRAKLFEFDSTNREWRERGVGIVKVNESFITGKARLLMRAEGVLRVLLNVRIFEGMKYLAVPEQRSVRYVAIIDGKPMQYLLKFKSLEDVNALLLEFAIYCDNKE